MAKELTVDEVYVKDLMKAINSLNKSNCAENKIETKGKKKEELFEEFLEEVTNVPEERESEIPEDVLELYNEIITGEQYVKPVYDEDDVDEDDVDEDDVDEDDVDEDDVDEDDVDDKNETDDDVIEDENNDDENDEDNKSVKTKKPAKKNQTSEKKPTKEKAPKKEKETSTKPQKEKKPKEEKAKNTFGFKEGSIRAVISDMFLEGTTLKSAAATVEKQFDKESIKSHNTVLGVIRRLVRDGANVEVTITAKPKK